MNNNPNNANYVASFQYQQNESVKSNVSLYLAKIKLYNFIFKIFIILFKSNTSNQSVVPTESSNKNTMRQFYL